MPISCARSTEQTRSLSLIVNSSMSSRLIWISPAITMPLSSTRSRMSARLAGPESRGRRSARPERESGRAVEGGSSGAMSVLVGLVSVVPASPAAGGHVPVAVHRDRVRTQNIGGVRDPRQLDHLDGDAPAIAVAALEAQNRFDRTAEQLRQVSSDQLNRLSAGQAVA